MNIWNTWWVMTRCFTELLVNHFNCTKIMVGTEWSTLWSAFQWMFMIWHFVWSLPLWKCRVVHSRHFPFSFISCSSLFFYYNFFSFYFRVRRFLFNAYWTYHQDIAFCASEDVEEVTAKTMSSPEYFPSALFERVSLRVWFSYTHLQIFFLFLLILFTYDESSRSQKILSRTGR